VALAALHALDFSTRDAASPLAQVDLESDPSPNKVDDFFAEFVDTEINEQA
jgi:hypothetical protein